jgi:hypothetical protein
MHNHFATAAMAALSIASTCWGAALAQSPGAVEAPPVLRAADLLAQQPLSGPQYRVEDRVTNDGLMNHYRITSEFGTFEAHSNAELVKRVQEIGAIAKLKRVEGSREFAKGVTAAGGQVVEGTVALVTKPVSTIGGAIGGAGAMLRRTGDAMFGDPKSRYEDNAAQAVSGVSQKKREFAAEMGVDPYSSNEVLQDALNRVARGAAAGNLLARGALAAVGGGAGTFVSVTGGSQSLNEMLRNTPPTDIRRANREKLQKMGISTDLIDLFQANVNYSPTYQMLLVDALERMHGVAGREAVVKVAISADSDALCMLRQRQARMYAAYHQQVQPIERFTAVGNLLMARTRDGRNVITVPVDYLAWTDTLAESMAGAEGPIKAAGGAGGRELWLGGTISPLARKTLEAQGWKVFDRASEKMIGPG